MHSQPGSISAMAAAAQGLTYEAAGVSIDAGSELVRRIQKMNPSIGGFSGMVPFGASTEHGSGVRWPHSAMQCRCDRVVKNLTRRIERLSCEVALGSSAARWTIQNSA